MRYRTLGKTGLSVSVIGIGTWQFGGEWGRDFTQSQVDAILDTAGELGINFIDTAECYGDHLAEKLVGDYLSRRDRSRWLVATKFGHYYHGFADRTEDYSTKTMRVQLEDSLKALRTDCIDLYQFHSGPDDTFRNQELWDALAELKRAGKVRHIGVSILSKGSEAQPREAAAYGAETLQIVYNRLNRQAEDIVFPYAQRDNLGIMARVPLASGLLSGKYKPGTKFSANDVRTTFDQEKMQAQMAEAEQLQKTEVPPGVPMGQWALAWCLKNPIVATVIPGCKDPEQVRDNAKGANLVA